MFGQNMISRLHSSRRERNQPVGYVPAVVSVPSPRLLREAAEVSNLAGEEADVLRRPAAQRRLVEEALVATQLDEDRPHPHLAAGSV